MSIRTALSLSFGLLLLAGCSKVSSDFHRAGDEAKQEIESLRQEKLDSQSTLEQRRDQIKTKLETVTAATKSEREKSAQAVLVNLYVQISALKEAQMLPPSDAATREVSRLITHADQCLREYDALVGNARSSSDENGPCLKEARAAASQ